MGTLPNIWHEFVHSGKQNRRDEQHRLNHYMKDSSQQGAVDNVTTSDTAPGDHCSDSMRVTSPCLLTSNPDTSSIFQLSQPHSTNQENKPSCLRGSSSVGFLLCAFWSKGWQTQQLFIMSMAKYLQPCANIYGQTYKKALLEGF